VAIELDLAALATREQQAHRMPSVVAGTARSGAVCGTVAVGVADVESGLLADPGVAYRIGSITKTFTAVLVLDLVERGRLQLDEPVGHYLPGMSFADVPLRMLLAHSGGIQREVPVDMWSSMQGPDRDALRAALARVEMVDRPGVRWHYSNLGFAALGQVVEEVTGKGCADLIDAQLLAPLGMTATSWARPDCAAVGYRLDPYADAVQREPDMDQGAIGVAGQLWSTVGDLLTWGDALAGGAPEVVPPAVVDAMHTVQVMVDPQAWSSAWGLGLILDRCGDRIVAGHTGAMPGFLAGLALDRATHSVAVVLANATRGLAAGRLTADIVLDVADTAPVPVPQPWTPAPPVPDELSGVLGRRWSEADETVFSWYADGLWAVLVSTGVRTRFERIDQDSYRAVTGRLCGERMLIHRDRDGGVAGLEWATYPFTREPR
jgi:CubicO group peptidase (beta-lactamase class C family)